MFRRLIRTQRDFAALVLRLTMAVVIFPHGAQKALAWFGGPGPAKALQGFQGMGIPRPLGGLDILAEFAGSILLVFGLLGRVAAFGIGVAMLTAIALVHQANGFFMNWTGRQPGEGFEYHLLVIGIAIAIMIRGSGAWSIDRAMSRPNLPRLSEERRPQSGPARAA